jgi:hypothetical protein
MIEKENKAQIYIKLMTNDQEKEEEAKVNSLFSLDFFGKKNTIPRKDIHIDDIDHISVVDEGEPMLCINPFEIDTNIIKYVCNYEIQIENDELFKVTSRIIGVKGMNVKKLLYDSCNPLNDNTTKLRLRGKGSGYREGIFHVGIIS